MQSSVFRRYDLRGKVPDDFNSNDFYKIAQEFGLDFPEGAKIAIAYDARLTGPEFEQKACSGLESIGANVHRLGMVPSPVCYYYVCNEKIDGAIMITSSHNPKDWNGAKLMREKAICLTWEEGIKDLRDRLLNESRRDPKRTSGSSKTVQYVNDYVNHVISKNGIKNNLRIVVDCANGASGPAVRKILQSLDLNFEILNEIPDGNFPAHEPDVFLSEVEEVVAESILDSGANIGFAIDGDGDRLRMFDDHGVPVPNDMLTAWLAEQILQKHPGSTILHEVRTGLGADEYISSRGGEIAFCKSGHSYVMAELIRLYPKAHFAGELTGHYYFAENYFFDDALFALTKALEIPLILKKPLSKLRQEFPVMEETPTQKIVVSDSIKHQCVEELKKKIAHLGGKSTTIDGLRLDFGDAFALVRAKNTEAAIETRFQAKTRQRLEELQEEIINSLESLLKQMN